MQGYRFICTKFLTVIKSVILSRIHPEQNTSQTPDVRECSVIEHEASYGHSEDKLEIMGLLTDEELQNDDVVGHLSAEEVFSRIQKHFIENNKMV